MCVRSKLIVRLAPTRTGVATTAPSLNDICTLVGAIDNRRDAFGTRPLYVTAKGELAERLGRGDVLPSAVEAWFAGTFDDQSPLISGFTPVPIHPERALGSSPDQVSSTSAPFGAPPTRTAPTGERPHAATAPDLLGALDAATSDLANGERDVHALLSGGLDSCAVVDSLHRQGFRVTAHLLVDPAVDPVELAAARGLVAEHKLTAVEHVVSDHDLPDAFCEAVRVAQRPLYNARAVSLHLLWRRIHGLGARAVFTGLGADELMFGNPGGLARPPPFVGALGVHRWPSALDLERARLHALHHVLEPLTLPPWCWASASLGISLRLPFLHEKLTREAARVPVTAWIVGAVGKHALRAALLPRLGAEICFAEKSPRLARTTAASPASRRWRELLEGCLDGVDPRWGLPPERIEGLRRALIPMPDAREPARYDAALLSLASFVVLAGRFTR